MSELPRHPVTTARKRRWGGRKLDRFLRRHQTLGGTLISFGLILLIVLLPVLLPVALVLHARDLRRRRASVERFVCAGCGQVLGLEALARADAAWAEYVEKLHREHPGYRFRLVREVDAICLQCGTRYHFDEKKRTFRAPEPKYDF